MEMMKRAGELGFGAVYCKEDFGGSGLSRLHVGGLCPNFGLYLNVVVDKC